MKRRSFLKHSAVGITALTSSLSLGGVASGAAVGKAGKFNMGFAPHPGMFRNLAGPDVIDQIKFASDQGFTAWEQNGMPDESPAMQEKIGKTLADLKMTMGVFVAYASFDEPTFAVKNADWQKEVLTKMKEGVDIAKRCGARWMTVVPGSVDQQSANTKNWNKYGGGRLAAGYQTANVIDMLRRCAEVLEPNGQIMVLEPLNWNTDHGGVFLQQSDQAYAVCRAVNSPSCKILFDIYHQQITEGNLIPNIDHCWDEIAYFQSGDNPGRKEPGSGEINYAKVFGHIHGKGYKGVVGMEHGISKQGVEGERHLIAAYRAVDSA